MRVSFGQVPLSSGMAEAWKSRGPGSYGRGGGLGAPRDRSALIGCWSVPMRLTTGWITPQLVMAAH
eukprot:5282594-Alexandrium_andersonii.AAC.1